MEVYMPDEVEIQGVKLMNTRAASRYCGYAETTLRSWISEGILTAVKVGNSYLLKESDIDATIRGLGYDRSEDHVIKIIK